MKFILVYVALLILLIVGASIDNGGLEAFSVVGMIGIAVFYFATFRGKINSATESVMDAQSAMDSSIRPQHNIDPHPMGSHDHTHDHGNHHHFDGGTDSSSWTDSSDTGGASHSD